MADVRLYEGQFGRENKNGVFAQEGCRKSGKDDFGIDGEREMML